MRKLTRLLLRIPYFYYWSWKKHPYDFELWMSFYISYNLANSPLKNLKVIIPNEYRDFVKKYPDFKPFGSVSELISRTPKEGGSTIVTWYEES